MGRGVSTSDSTAVLYGRTGPRGAIDELGEIKLSPKQEVALRALLALSLNRSAPGFETYDICEAASPFEQHPQQCLMFNTTGTILGSLKKRGLVARSQGCLKGASGLISESEPGWTLTPRGAKLAADL